MSDMTLYAVPFTCSFAVHLVLVTQGKAPAIQWQTRGEGRRISGSAFAAINPKRKVPALVVDGALHTEIVAILHGLDGGTDTEHLRWLSFLATEFHAPVLGPLFDKATPKEAREDVVNRFLPGVLSILEEAVDDEGLTGGRRGADAYLFWSLLLLRYAKFDLPPKLSQFMGRWLADPQVLGVIGIEQAARASMKGA